MAEETTEYTQSGNGHFLAYSIIMEKSAQPGEVGGCTLGYKWFSQLDGIHQQIDAK